MLKSMTPYQLDGYLKSNAKCMAGYKKAFYYYMKDVLNEKNIKLKDSVKCRMKNQSQKIGSVEPFNCKYCL